MSMWTEGKNQQQKLHSTSSSYQTVNTAVFYSCCRENTAVTLASAKQNIQLPLGLAEVSASLQISAAH